MGALEADAGQDTGEASRAGLETWESMAGLEIREARADPGTRKAMAEQET